MYYLFLLLLLERVYLLRGKEECAVNRINGLNYSDCKLYSILYYSTSSYLIILSSEYLFSILSKLTSTPLTSLLLLLLIIPSGNRRNDIKLWKSFVECFNCMPFSAIVDKRVFCTHGGLSPDLHSMDQIRGIQRPTSLPDSGISQCSSWEINLSIYLSYPA